MDLTPSLNPSVEQSQKQIVTAQMLQSLQVLRMPMPELAQYLGERICENPMLDIEALSQSELLPEPSPPPAQDPRDEDVDETVRSDYRDIWHGNGLDAARLGCGESTFADMLLEQVNTGRLDGASSALCRYIVGCLNQRGYLDIPLEEIARETGCALPDAERALRHIQEELHPAGVGARSLGECLLLQLGRSRTLNAHTIRLVSEGLPLLAANDLGAIQKLLRCTRNTAEHCAQVVRGLNPIPSQGYFTGERNGFVVPDAIVQNDGGALSLRLNDRYLPRVRLSRAYCDWTAADEEEKRYLAQKLKEAGALQRAVEERGKTLRAVMRCIVGRQSAFFRTGAPLAPMNLAEIAGSLGLNISTVSRAIQGKYIEGPFGTIEIKKLFSGAVKGAAGGAVSSDAAKRKLRRLIRDEDPKMPLSDESLRLALCAAGIDLARRTIAKYREELGLPPARQRRR